MWSRINPNINFFFIILIRSTSHPHARSYPSYPMLGTHEVPAPRSGTLGKCDARLLRNNAWHSIPERGVGGTSRSLFLPEWSSRSDHLHRFESDKHNRIDRIM